MGLLVRWLLAPFLFVTALAGLGLLPLACWQHLSSLPQRSLHAGVWAALPLGFAFRTLAALLFRRFGKNNPLAFIDTLEHELTHALFGYLTLNPPLSLKASLQGDGEVLLRGQNVFTLLAPYFFPLWTFLAAGMAALLDHRFRFWGTLATLALAGNFLFRLLAEYRWRQSDLHGYGFAFSTGLVLTLLPLSLGMVFALIGVSSWSWPLGLPRQAWHHLLAAFDFGRRLWLWLAQPGSPPR